MLLQQASFLYLEIKFFFVLFCFLVVMGIKLRALCMLARQVYYNWAELQLQSFLNSQDPPPYRLPNCLHRVVYHLLTAPEPKGQEMQRAKAGLQVALVRQVVP